MVLPQDQLSLIRRSSQRMLLGRLSTIEGLRDMPLTVAGELAGLEGDAIAKRPAPDDWSLKEICGHLRDVAVIGDMRVHMILTQSSPKLPVLDSAWVSERNYQDQDIGEVLAAYQAARARTIDRIEFLADANWARTGYHPEDGHMSLRQLTERLLAHERVHLDQLRETKAAALG
jgi:hypothetical protein